MVWLLYALTEKPEIQKRLRDEIQTVPTEAPTLGELNALPYMDMVIRETLRLFSPVPSTLREAGKDDIIPLSRPFTTRDGVICDSIAYAFLTCPRLSF